MEFELLKQISQFGLLGITLALVAWVSLHLWRDLKLSWEARLTENKHLICVVEATNSTYSALAAATENRAKAQEAVAVAQQATAKALETQLSALHRLSDSNENLIRSMERLNMQSEKLCDEVESMQRLLEDISRSKARAR